MSHIQSPVTTKQNPLSHDYQEDDDRALITSSLEGNKAALNLLLKKHEPYIYNIAWKMVLNPEIALDITQEVMLKVVTRLSSFRGESSFRTWLYSIAFRHFLNMKRAKTESFVTDFDSSADRLNSIEDHPLSPEEQLIYAEETEEIRIRCTSGMLLCLNREQRLIFILGEIFEVEQQTAAELLGISSGNFRVKLHRARKDLQSYMLRQCGLVNPENACRCSKKTKSMIKMGIVDPKSRLFNKENLDNIAAWAVNSSQYLKEKSDTQQQLIFQTHKFQNQFSTLDIADLILEHPELTGKFTWNN